MTQAPGNGNHEGDGYPYGHPEDGDFLVGDRLFQPSLNRVTDENGEPVSLEPRLASLLVFLARRAGKVVSKEEIRDGVWQATHVADSAITRAMTLLRRALGDDAHAPTFIETIPKRGYRLVAQVVAVMPEESETLPVVFAHHRQRTFVGVAVVAVLLCLVVGLSWAMMSRQPATANPAGARAVGVWALAVLPLEDLSPEPGAQAYFVEGMTDAMITALARIPDLRVVSRRSAEECSAQDPTLSEIGEILGVDAVVEGSILRLGDRVRISAKLTDVHSGAHLWAQSYERRLADILALQVDVSNDVARRIRDAVAPVDTAVRQVDPQAHDLYLRGDYLLHEMETMEEALDLFRAALDIDPTYAVAHAGVARFYLRQALFSKIPPEEGFPKARQAALEAIGLEESLGSAHATLATVRFVYDWDWQAADREFRRARQLDRSDPSVATGYVMYLTAMGRFDEALPEFRRSKELDPLSHHAGSQEGWIHFNAGHYAEASEMLAEADPGLSALPGLVPRHGWPIRRGIRHLRRGLAKPQRRQIWGRQGHLRLGPRPGRSRGRGPGSAKERARRRPLLPGSLLSRHPLRRSGGARPGF